MRWGARRIVRAMAVVFAALGPVACGSSGDVDVETIELRVDERANGNAPVPVDLVLVSDEALVEQVLGMTAADWFSRRDQVRRDYPRTVQVHSWELVPGQTVPRQDIRRLDDLWAAVVFAHYDTDGPHRLRVDTYTDLTLRLGEEGFDIVSD